MSLEIFLCLQLQSILDDHVDQVFNKEEEANKLLLSKSQRRQADGRSVFSRVSTAAPIHQQVPKSHQQQRVSSTSSQFQDLNLTNGYSKNLPLNHSASTSSWSLNSLSRSVIGSVMDFIRKFDILFHDFRTIIIYKTIMAISIT